MMRALTTLLALLIATGCAPKRAPQHPTAVADPAPFTDQELVEELVRQGVGTPTDTPTDPKPRPGEELPTGIRQTPRGVVVTFRHVFFAFDRADLNPRARLEVERMALVLNHPRASDRRIVLEGHADAIGTDAYNLALSGRRADAVAQELVARGVRRDRLSVEGFGEQRPVAPNTLPDGSDNPAGRALNRRVEAVIRTPDGAPR